eukprot:CAMPEP_0113313746 /NCGR_PEP_ID=MMETSP0010_2-20120614/10051_1 /TAXON_ID=216773 ORGANISM="Corethron hystrix, Strain 308" /NCGR_SAMPLE_ID=MMETSP0010_2 /ASSEMBLY_ACC=CAM_ASM_000155 /LENGTH=327 /DNA_ID=CAMNT_0000169829 /DNA_START=234 /DNA_END=1213 /DNA_ORIENTATION=+ /assembly_acc=CAM_ASM_000155
MTIIIVGVQMNVRMNVNNGLYVIGDTCVEEGTNVALNKDVFPPNESVGVVTDGNTQSCYSSPTDGPQAIEAIEVNLGRNHKIDRVKYTSLSSLNGNVVQLLDVNRRAIESRIVSSTEMEDVEIDFYSYDNVHYIKIFGEQSLDVCELEAMFSNHADCRGGFFVLETTNECVATCPTGFYEHHDKCKEFNSNVAFEKHIYANFTCSNQNLNNIVDGFHNNGVWTSQLCAIQGCGVDGQHAYFDIDLGIDHEIDRVVLKYADNNTDAFFQSEVILFNNEMHERARVQLTENIEESRTMIFDFDLTDDVRIIRLNSSVDYIRICELMAYN